MDAHEPQRRRSRGKSSASSKSKVTVVALWVGLPGSGSCVINANGGLFSDPGARLGDTELHYLAGRDLAGFGWAALSPELAALHHTPSRPALILTDKLLQLGDPGATQAVASALREVGCRTVALVPGLGEWGASSAAGGVRRVEAAEVELVALSYPPSDTVKAAIALMLSSVFVDGAQCNSGPSSRISWLSSRTSA